MRECDGYANDKDDDDDYDRAYDYAFATFLAAISVAVHKGLLQIS